MSRGFVMSTVSLSRFFLSRVGYGTNMVIASLPRVCYV